MHTGSSGYPKISRVSVRMHTLEHSFSEFRRQTLDPERERLRIPEKKLGMRWPRKHRDSSPLYGTLVDHLATVYLLACTHLQGKQAGRNAIVRWMGPPDSTSQGVGPRNRWLVTPPPLQLRIETKLALELYEPHAKGLLGWRIQRPVRIRLHWASP